MTPREMRKLAEKLEKIAKDLRKGSAKEERQVGQWVRVNNFGPDGPGWRGGETGKIVNILREGNDITYAIKFPDRSGEGPVEECKNPSPWFLEVIKCPNVP
jgi:hypothetical protein